MSTSTVFVIAIVSIVLIQGFASVRKEHLAKEKAKKNADAAFRAALPQRMEECGICVDLMKTELPYSPEDHISFLCVEIGHLITKNKALEAEIKEEYRKNNFLRDKLGMEHNDYKFKKAMY